MTPETKIKLIKDIQKLTLKMFEVPDDKVNMNSYSSCAFHFFDALTNEILAPLSMTNWLDRASPMNQKCNELFAVGLNCLYPNPRGRYGKLEFRRRALAFIEAVRDDQS